MKPFTLSRVPKLVFGDDALSQASHEIDLLTGDLAPVMIVADPALKPLGIVDRLIAVLAEMGGREYLLYDGFTGEPKAADIDAAARMAGGISASAMIGIGGGTALDTAKLAAACAISGKPAEAYQLCATPLPHDPLPLIAIPTTAGTGAEASRTVIFSNARHEKVWAWGDELKPSVALLDPELTVGIPPAVTAATGLDALVHAIEASTNRNRHDANDLYCHRAIALIAANLEKAVKTPGDRDARGALLLGSFYAGIGIDNCGTALAHNISHAMADLAPIPHGRATALAMLATIGWVKEGNREAFARVARAMGGPEDAAHAASAYERLVRSSGMKISLTGDGLELNRPEKLAERMASPANTPMRKSTARDVSDADLLMLAERVYTLS